MLSSITSVAVFGLAAIGQAHIIMTSPAPFVGVEQGPIAESNYPCQGGGGGAYTVPQGGRASMPLGSSQSLAFVGTAVHGGGSCQISITYDQKPTKDSVFKVIHSIHGGCPMRNIEGNNGNSATQPVPDTFPFTIPSDLPTGEAVLAWTWFNRVGNREMYMNCAPITITGGSTRRDEGNATQLIERDIATYNALPNIYVANLDQTTCVTTEGINIEFPNPGSSLEVNAGGKFEKAPACGDKNNGGSAPAPSAISPPATSAAPTPTSLPGGVFVPTGGDEVSTPIATATSVSSPPVITSVEAPAPTLQPTTLTVIPTKASSVAPPSGTGSAGVLTGPCSPEGLWNCIGGTSFQRCGSGQWSVAQPLAAGTTCTEGQSNAFEIHAIGSKRRAVRFSGAHIRRHLRSS